jgi:adenylate kinase family enzyme
MNRLFIFIGMKKIFTFIIGFGLLACSPKITTDGGEGNIGNVMINAIDKKISMAQFDSLCIADTLPRKLAYWNFLGLKNYEDNERVLLFSYMKKDGTIYRVEETMDDSVKIRKRMIIMLDE